MATQNLTVTDVVAALGGTLVVAKLCRVGISSISNWRTANEFPPKHHLLIDRLCRAKRIDYDPMRRPRKRAA